MQYRSGIKYRIDGNATFANPAVPAAPAVVGVLANAINTTVLFDTRVVSRVRVPGIVNLSYFATLNDRWDGMADAQWPKWSVIRKLTFQRADGTEDEQGGDAESKEVGAFAGASRDGGKGFAGALGELGAGVDFLDLAQTRTDRGLGKGGGCGCD